MLTLAPDKDRKSTKCRIGLRPARFSDASFFFEVLGQAEILRTSCAEKPLTQSRFLLWWWLRRRYASLYCIEADSKLIGFIGLYNLREDSGDITLVIFNEKDRRLGYGTRAFTLFVQGLPSYFPKRMFVSVAKDNHPSLSFWRRLGFRESADRDHIMIMCADLD